MIFKDAVKAKVRLSITGMEESSNSVLNNQGKINNQSNEKLGNYGWNLEPPPISNF